MAKLTFHGGVNEIGGNKILVRDRKTKLLFDFGQSFSFGAEYFTGWLSPRAINGLRDQFDFELLPKIMFMALTEGTMQAITRAFSSN
jgi:ribonuclease J